ncbi:MAG: flagellar biosynthesis protein FlhB [Ideonella sp.]|nr:flagellar biosynthesis protein FlhB [Ideonella sp.]MCC7457873.1 flagellar biosynthesis protein FlhB [Nitrospira sp.]
MAADSQDRNLPASQRRIAKAREQGQVARSRDLAHLLSMAAGVVGLMLVAPWATRSAGQLLAEGLRFDARALASTQPMLDGLGHHTWQFALVVLPLGVLMITLALAAAVVGGGWNWSLKAMVPRFGKLDPWSGLGRLLSFGQLGDTLKACALALVLAVVGGLYLSRSIAQFHDALAMPLPAALAQVAHAWLSGALLLLLVLAVFAAVDVPLQRHLWLRRLKMSREEAKQEMKELEGNLEVKAKVKARMREMTKRRMLAAVPGADLVVMNPTHYAVALKYDEATMAAPRVVAKGADLLAMRIRDLARDARVPVLRAPPLARALYTHVEVDREVPTTLFAAVAQVLAYVYQLRAALTGNAPMPPAVPDPQLPPGLDPHEKMAASPAEAAE